MLQPKKENLFSSNAGKKPQQPFLKGRASYQGIPFYGTGQANRFPAILNIYSFKSRYACESGH